MYVPVGHTQTSRTVEFEHTSPLSSGAKLFSEGTLLFATVITKTQVFKDVVSCKGRQHNLSRRKWELAQASGSCNVWEVAPCSPQGHKGSSQTLVNLLMAQGTSVQFWNHEFNLWLWNLLIVNFFFLIPAGFQMFREPENKIS